MNRIYCIPTNRNIYKTLSSYIKEGYYAYKKFNEIFP